MSAKSRPAVSKEQRYLEAGLRCMNRVGIAGATMDAIATEAGVKRITLYRCFGSRTHLIRLIVRSQFESFLERFAQRIVPGSSVASLLEEYFLYSMDEMLRDAVTRETIQGKLDFTAPGEPLHAAARAFWGPILGAPRSGKTPLPKAELDLAAQWILVCQFTLCRLQIEAPMDIATARKLIRSYIGPAFGGGAKR